MSRRHERASAAAAPPPAAPRVEVAPIVAPPVKRPWQLAVSSALLLAWMLFLAVMAWG